MSAQNDEDHSIRSHTLHMRRAAGDIRRRVDELRVQVAGGFEDSFSCNLINFACLASQEYQKERDAGVQDVSKRLHICHHSSLPIDTIQVKEDGSSWKVISPPKEANDNQTEWNDLYQFKQHYISRNIPCIIRGLDKSHFATISTQWRTTTQHPDVNIMPDSNDSQDQMYDSNFSGNGSDANKCNATNVNTEWFRCFVGNDTLVPVRIDNFRRHDSYNNENVKEQDCLDDEGRAQECETKQIKLDEWIIQCREQSRQYFDDPANNMSTGYLKDWHLVQYLLDKQKSHPNEKASTYPLYTTPTFFQRDLLNNFLTRYSDGGDYKFTYWGPAGSQTRLHSDVLHSLSWSYNVVGKKKWIFHAPACHEKGDNSTSTFEVIQHTGEAIFVPSKWKHEVFNLVETISINHNWITTANIDQTWDCLKVEIAAIEEEVEAWGVIPKDDFEARENMLRGCIGLDVTMFTLVVLLEVVELMQIMPDVAADEHEIAREDVLIDIFRLEIVLGSVMRLPDLFQRLEATLCSHEYALQIKDLAIEVMQYSSTLKHSNTNYQGSHSHEISTSKPQSSLLQPA